MSLQTFDSLFDPFFIKSFGLRTPELEEGFDLCMNLTETAKEYKLEVEIPGVEKSEVKIEVEEHFLRVLGEVKKPEEEQGEKHLIIERSYGRFDRKIRLPRNADMENVKASFLNGLLKICIPKHDVSKIPAKQIQIE